MIRVALVEDDATVRENLARLLDGTPGCSCVAGCGSVEEALRVLPGVRPAVVLMDIHLPGRSGIDCVAELRSSMPGVLVIMLTVETDSSRVFESLKAGATGYLVKHATPAEIVEAVRQVHGGGAPMSGEIARMVVTAFQEAPSPDVPEAKLSPRELTVLRWLSRGLRTKEIATEMRITPGTVNTYIRHIYEKLHVRSRAEAVWRLKKAGPLARRPPHLSLGRNHAANEISLKTAVH